MLATRANARGQIIEDFREVPESDLEALVDRWFSDETQAALRAMVERLAAKRV